MSLQKTINASFPRSGHHMLRNILQAYFGDEMKYCKWSDDFEKRPTVCHETNFTMVHDLHLTFPVTPEFKHLVLFRHPLYSLASWRIHKTRPEGNICEDQEITKQKLEFWAKWINKWVLSPVPNRLIVTYERLLENPFRVIPEIVTFLTDDSFDSDRIEKVIRFQPPQARTNTTQEWIGWR